MVNILSYENYSDTFQITNNGFVQITPRGIIYIAVGSINIRIEIHPEDLDAYIILQSNIHQIMMGSVDVGITLKSYPKIFINDSPINITNDLPSKNFEKIESLEWTRATINEVPFVLDRFDLRFNVVSKVVDNINLTEDLISIFSKYSNKIVYSKMDKIEPTKMSLKEIRDFAMGRDFEEAFSLLSLVSRKGRYLINKISFDQIRSVVDFDEFCNKLDSMYSSRFYTNNNNNNTPSSKCMIGIRCVVVTPLSLTFSLEYSNDTNRVLRYFDNDKFLRVGIRDEKARYSNDYTRNNDKVYDYFRTILMNGVSIGRRRYFFLAMTTSQLKMHNCWFISPYKEDNIIIGADYIKSWLGDFHDIKT